MRTKLIWALGLPACVAALVGQLALPGPAHAALSGSDHAFVSPGSQYGYWSHPSRQIQLITSPTSSMSASRCMDAMLDWQPTSGHYDARVVRSCQPGGQESTDPGGNGVWTEPSGWDGATIVDMQKGWGARISDAYVSGNFAMYASEALAGTLGGAYTSRPRTCIDKFARVRTKYQDGHTESCDSKPTDANG